MSRKRESDDKTLNDKVDQLVRNAQKVVAKLMAQITRQDAQRAQGIYVPQRPANNPPRAHTKETSLFWSKGDGFTLG